MSGVNDIHAHTKVVDVDLMDVYPSGVKFVIGNNFIDIDIQLLGLLVDKWIEWNGSFAIHSKEIADEIMTQANFLSDHSKQELEH